MAEEFNKYKDNILNTEYIEGLYSSGGDSDKAVLYRIADEDITGVYLTNKNTLLLTVDKPVCLVVNSVDGKHLDESDKAVVFMKDYMLLTMLTMEKDLGDNQEMYDLLVQSIPVGFDPDLYSTADGMLSTAATPLYYDLEPGQPYFKLPCVEGIVYEKMGMQSGATPYEGDFSLSDIGGPLYAWGWPLLFERMLQSSQTYKSRVRGAGTNILQKLREQFINKIQNENK